VSIVLICLGSLVGVASLQAPYKRAAATLPEELSAARAAGWAIEPADLAARVAAPEGHNVAPLYRTAIGLLQIGPPDHAIREITSGEDIASTPETWRELESVLEAAERGARMSHCDFGRTWQDGVDLELPEYSDLRTLVQLFAARAQVMARDGRAREAFADLDSIAGIARHVSQEPLLVSILVGMSFEGIAHDTLEQVLDARRPSRDTIQLAERFLSQLSELPDLNTVLQSELMLGRLGIRSSGGGGSRGAQARPSQLGAGLMRYTDRQGLHDAVEARLLANYRKIFHALDNHSGDWKEQELALRKLETEFMADPDPASQEARPILPALQEVTRALGRQHARRCVTAAAVWTLRYRLEQGRLPLALPAEQKFMDPFVRVRLTYLLQDDGFLLYSVGVDGLDDGGHPSRDIVFTGR
jgi:hypothetical protein